MNNPWSGIKSITTTKIKSHHLISQVRVKNVDYDDPKIIVDKFNNFFVNVAENVQKVSRMPQNLTDITLNHIFLYPCIAKDVEDIIHLLNPAKVSGPYSIHVKVISKQLKHRKACIVQL